MLKIETKLHGYIAWSIIKQDGTIRASSRRRKNMIVNDGYELLANYGYAWYGDLDSGPGYPTAVALVGTGTSDPTVDDTSVDGELATTTQNGGISTVVEAISDGVYDITYTRQFAASAVGGQNLTRWAMAPALVGSPHRIFAQDKFRDNNGDPVTLTLAADEQLRLSWTLRVSFSPITPTAYSSNGIDGQLVLVRDDPGYRYRGYGDLALISRLMSGATRTYETLALTSDQPLGYTDVPSGGVRASSTSAGSYTAGSRSRTMTAKWGTEAANGDIYGFSLARIYCSPGIHVKFDNPITKDDTQEISITIKVTW